MQELLYFKLKHCPYCKRADAMLAQLRLEDERYAQVPITIVDEGQEPELADAYDYYYVPAFFLGKRRLFSGVPTLKDVQSVLEEALKP